MFEGEFDGLEFLLRTVGEVGDGAVFDFAVLAEGLAEVDGLINFAVGGRPGSPRYIHDHIIYKYDHFVKDKIDL